MIFYRRHKRVPVINITSLIDVQFMLLIFLMVTTTFVQVPSIQLQLPEARHGMPASAEGVVVAISEVGEVYLRGERVELAELAQRLRAIVRAEGDQAVVLHADAGVAYGAVVQVMDSVAEAGLTRVVATTRFPETESE